MKSHRWIKLSAMLCLLMTTFFVESGSFAKKNDEKTLNIGYSSKTFLDVDIKDATAALNVWIRELSEEKGFSATNTVYDGINTFVNDFNKNKLDFGIVKSLDFLRIRNSISAEIALAHVKGNKKTIKYLLLVPNKKEFSNIQALKGKRLSLRKGDELGMIFLNTYLLKNHLPEENAFFSTVQYQTRNTQLLLSVFFGQADACIITDQIFKTMSELNPQISQKLKILVESPEFVEGVNFFRSDYNEEYKKIVREQSQKMHETVRGRQIMLLFKFDRVIPLEEHDLDTVKQLIAEYKQLRNNR